MITSVRAKPKAHRPAAAAQALAITSESALEHAVACLRASDPVVIGAMLDACGMPPLRAREDGFAGLAWIVVAQQVSTASAQAIFARLRLRFPDLAFAEVLQASEDELKTCGLSAPKIRTMRALAQAFADGAIDSRVLANVPAAEARAMLTAIHGIGPWTADIYLLFCLGHPDVWPAGDLALQEGVRIAMGLRNRPDAARLEKLSLRWSPWRAAAARIIWAYYGVARPVAKTAKDKPSPAGKTVTKKTSAKKKATKKSAGTKKPRQAAKLAKRGKS
ncbi:MAG: DNA-3-methyladenine glycosylase 2 family protein [Alphaproteobacteria bacterium]|nr:DNA-3-methyladenine glycosylase 2 family protein [Alphaproteobacteria bacterium]